MKAFKTVLFVGVLLALSGCGGGGGSSSNNDDSPQQPATQTGIFLDSPVINIGYRTETITDGITNAQGEYEYLEGETVTFFIGDLDFPPVTASGVVTPLDIAGTQDTSDTAVVNIIRLLQTLDEDGNPDNGITITDLAKGAATQVSFDVPESEFESSVANLVANSGSSNITLVSQEQAITHFEGTLASNDIPFGGVLGAWELPNENVIFIFFPDNRYYAIQWEEENNFIGFERGTYTNDTSSITFTTLQNNDGEALVCNEPENVTCSNEAFEYSISSNGLTLNNPNEPDDAPVTFEKLTLTGDDLFGIWELPNESVIFMFLPDNRYYAIQWEEENNFIGFERGTYTNDTSSITFTTLQNNDGEALVCNEPENITCSNEMFDFSISNNILTLNNPNEPEDDPVSFSKIL